MSLTFTGLSPDAPVAPVASELHLMMTDDSRVARKVLLVDDDDHVRRLTQRMLEAAGYEVETVSGGEEALTLARSLAHVDILITDVVMPGMMGGAVARAISAMFPEAHVLLMSGFMEDASVIANVAAGKWRYLAKPFTGEQLRLALSAAMNSRL